MFRQERRQQVAWAFPTRQRAGRAARLTATARGARPPVRRTDRPRGQAHRPLRLVYVYRMYWPLIGGFVAFLLLLLILGRVVDTSRADRDGH